MNHINPRSINIRNQRLITRSLEDTRPTEVEKFIEDIVDDDRIYAVHSEDDTVDLYHKRIPTFGSGSDGWTAPWLGTVRLEKDRLYWIGKTARCDVDINDPDDNFGMFVELVKSEADKHKCAG